MDDLLGEVQTIKSAVTGCEGSLSRLEDKVIYSRITCPRDSATSLLILLHSWQRISQGLQNSWKTSGYLQPKIPWGMLQQVSQ